MPFIWMSIGNILVQAKKKRGKRQENKRKKKHLIHIFVPVIKFNDRHTTICFYQGEMSCEYIIGCVPYVLYNFMMGMCEICGMLRNFTSFLHFNGLYA